MGLQTAVIPYCLAFGYSNCAFRTNLDTGFTTETLIHLNGLGFAVFKLEHLCRARIDTFLTTGTFIFIYNNFKHDTPPR